MWVITEDTLDKKTVNIRSCNFNPEKKLTEEFRLLDDDGVECYRGRSDDSETEEGFAPLDDFGICAAGCTEIQYLRNGKWETL